MYDQIMKEICDELDIKMTLLSENWLMLLEKDNKKRFIVGYKFDLNVAGTSYLLDDKYLLYEILKRNGISVIMHHLVTQSDYNNDANKVLNTIYNYYEMYDHNIVLKINNGTCGNDVIHITCKRQIKKAVADLIKKDYTISVCPFYKIQNEYRAVYLKGKVLLMYAKEKPIVIGDGIKTLKELLVDFNKEYYKDIEVEDKVLKDKQIYEYGWQFNLSKGARPNLEIEDTTRSIIENMAIKIGEVTNLKFGSIDIIKTNDNKYYCLEANSGVSMKKFAEEAPNGYTTAKQIYKEAVKEMFR